MLSVLGLNSLRLPNTRGKDLVCGVTAEGGESPVAITNVSLVRVRHVSQPRRQM